LVEDQRRVRHPVSARDGSHDVITVGHLRDGLWAHEAGGLDAGVAGVDEAGDELDLLVGREVGRVGPQPVTWRHFDKRYCGGYRCAHNALSSRDELNAASTICLTFVRPAY